MLVLGEYQYSQHCCDFATKRKVFSYHMTVVRYNVYCHHYFEITVAIRFPTKCYYLKC